MGGWDERGARRWGAGMRLWRHLAAILSPCRAIAGEAARARNTYQVRTVNGAQTRFFQASD